MTLARLSLVQVVIFLVLKKRLQAVAFMLADVLKFLMRKPKVDERFDYYGSFTVPRVITGDYC
jgi:hypothetical protein